jgi:hypothetical protein
LLQLAGAADGIRVRGRRGVLQDLSAGHAATLRRVSEFTIYREIRVDFHDRASKKRLNRGYARSTHASAQSVFVCSAFHDCVVWRIRALRLQMQDVIYF